MEIVPVKENVQKWTSLYSRMSRGEKADINDQDLQQLSVEGIPPNLTGRDGQLKAPKEAGNVIPPVKTEPDTPEAYDDAVAMRTKYPPKKRGKTNTRRSSTKKKTNRRRSGPTKRRTKGKKKQQSRRRGKITKR